MVGYNGIIIMESPIIAHHIPSITINEHSHLRHRTDPLHWADSQRHPAPSRCCCVKPIGIFALGFSQAKWCFLMGTLCFLMEKSEIPIDPDPILEDHWMFKKNRSSPWIPKHDQQTPPFWAKGHTRFVRMSGEILYRKRMKTAFTAI